MKLIKLRVSGWRCFARPLELPDFGPGLNIVHGPNGVGKTSLFGTLVRVFGDRFKSKADAIRILQPWGTDLSPHATLEFEHDGQRWQLDKQFLTGAFTKLQRWDGGHWKPIAENESADDRLRDMLQMEPPKGKTYQPDQWGLAQMLWAEQGDLQLGALSAPARNLVQQSLGAQIVGAEGTEVEGRVEQDFLELFTPNGKPRSGANAPPIVAAQTRLAEVQQRLVALRRRLQEFDEAVRRIEDRRLLADQAQREEQQVATQEAQARLQAEAYTALVQERDLAAKELERTRARAEQMRQRLDAITSARQEMAKWQESSTQLLAADEGLKNELALRQKFADDATANLANVRQARDEIERSKRRTERAERFHKALRQMNEGEQLLAQLKELAQQRDALQQQRNQLLAPDARQLAALRKAFRDRDDARLRLDASLITLEVRAEQQLEVEVIHGQPVGPSGSSSLDPATSFQLRGSPEVAVRLPGIATIQARGPAGSVDELRQQSLQAEKRLEELSAPWGTQDLAALEVNCNQATQLDSQLRELTIRTETLLGKRTWDEVQRDFLMAQKLVEEVLTGEPAWRSAPPDVQQMQRQDDQQEQQFVAGIDRAEKQRDLAADELNRQHARYTQHSADLRQAQSQVATLQNQLLQWTNDGLTDEARTAALETASLEFIAAQAKLKAANEKLQAAGDDPRQSARLLHEQGQALRKVANEALSKLNYAEGELRQLTVESPYSALAQAEEDEARLQEEIARYELEMNAVKLLHTTLQAQRKSLVDALVGPVRQRVSRLMHRIVGPRFGELEIDQEFAATGIHPRDQESSVPLQQLSGGEREQVHFAVRLALAELAFPGGGQLVVLDDVFTFTDRLRLARVAQVLAEVAQRFQVVLLTCHPERYSGLTDARFFDLDTLTNQTENGSL